MCYESSLAFLYIGCGESPPLVMYEVDWLCMMSGTSICVGHWLLFYSIY